MRSWGGLPEQPQTVRSAHWQDQILTHWQQETLATGMGRSYGDAGLAASGQMLSTRGMDRIISFDTDTGLIRCEAGVQLGDIMRLVVPQDWMLPVLPGTQFVTVAGAVANDIHGKNHHRTGSFGSYVTRLGLLRSSGELIECGPNDCEEWFAATVGGLGLTGIITWVEIQLRPVSGAWLNSETIKFNSLQEFFELSESSAQTHVYTVSWIDCLSQEVRGHFNRANHADTAAPLPRRKGLPGVPVELPISPINRWTLKAFNSLYFHRQRGARVSELAPWDRWFFPLDAIPNWNRMYGRRGFRQYQCVVPDEQISELLAAIRHSGEGSFLAVLKQFGDRPSPGLISFPRQGTTLALDFPWRGTKTLDLFKQLDAIVFSSGGALYPAKDAHMSALDFKMSYPAWEEIEQRRDPKLNSLFWQRVTGV